MNSLAALIAPLALLLPASLADAPVPQGETGLRLAPEREGTIPPLLADPADARPWDTLSDSLDPPGAAQVRIEQRVTIRIAPRPQASRQELMAQLPRGERASRIEERKIGSCVPAGGIAGVGTTSDNRLLLFMRDRRIISAALEKACSARDFYSGFYLERSKDGQLCVKRDMIHSRAGAKCELKQIRQLVAVRD